MYLAPGTCVRRQEWDNAKVGGLVASALVAVVAGAFTCIPDGNVMRRAGLASSLFLSRNLFTVGGVEGIVKSPLFPELVDAARTKGSAVLIRTREGHA
jgi:hypothetical protein